MVTGAKKTISRSEAVLPIPNVAEKVKDDETKMRPLDFVINMLLISAENSFYEVVRKRSDWRGSRTAPAPHIFNPLPVYFSHPPRSLS